MKKLFFIGGGIGIGVIAWLAMRKKTATVTDTTATASTGITLSTDVTKVAYAPPGSVVKAMQPGDYGNTYYDANGNIVSVTEMGGTDGTKYFTDQNNIGWKITPDNPSQLQPWTPDQPANLAPLSVLVQALQGSEWYTPTSRFATTLNPTPINQASVNAYFATIDATGAMVSPDGTRFAQLVSPNHIEVYKDAGHSIYANTWYSKTPIDTNTAKAIKSPAFTAASNQVAGLKGLTTIKTTI